MEGWVTSADNNSHNLFGSGQCAGVKLLRTPFDVCTLNSFGERIEKLKVAQTLAVFPTQFHCSGLKRSPMEPILRWLNAVQTLAPSFKLKSNSRLLPPYISPK
jgi:hypothetical protein